jgi:nicotinic acid mononucleotide adenylyltransferase
MSSPYSIIPIKTAPVAISSTKIRERIKGGITIENLVPEKVKIYIEKNRLYS